MKQLASIICLLLLIAAIQTKSQIFNETRIGVGVLGSSGINEGKTRPFDIGGRLMVRTPLISMFSAEAGVSYFKNSGETYYPGGYKTEVIPIDLKLLFHPISNDLWNPYIFGGIGAFHYNVITKSPLASAEETKTGWSGFFKGGAGIEMALSRHFSIDAHFSGNRAFSDNLNNEQDNIYDGYWNVIGSIIFTPFGGTRDSDGDGLSDELENQTGTDEDVADTDGDGLNDGDEYNLYKTAGTRPDTDGDGLKDGEEVKIYKTDPLKSDTDGEGLSDADEINRYKTDPLKADTDGEGLNDSEELTYKTDPIKKDTDSDVLNDADEVKKYKTNPLDADTDGDGLNDSEELTKYKTNPLKPDSDMGSIDDGIEVKRGTNPNDAKDDIAAKKETLKTEVGKSMVLEGIVFETGKSTILPESETILTKALNTLTENPGIIVEIQGHTDNAGKKASNMKLSKDRADAVKAWLLTRGIADNRISTKGFGPDKPLVPNSSPENMKKNRRIEFVRLK